MKNNITKPSAKMSTLQLSTYGGLTVREISKITGKLTTTVIKVKKAQQLS